MHPTGEGIGVRGGGDRVRLEVSVALHTDKVEDQRIDQGLTETLDQVQRLVEAGPAPANT